MLVGNQDNLVPYQDVVAVAGGCREKDVENVFRCCPGWQGKSGAWKTFWPFGSSLLCKKLVLHLHFHRRQMFMVCFPLISLHLVSVGMW